MTEENLDERLAAYRSTLETAINDRALNAESVLTKQPGHSRKWSALALGAAVVVLVVGGVIALAQRDRGQNINTPTTSPTSATSATSATVAPSTATPSTVRGVTPIVIDPDDPRPILTMGFWSKGPVQFFRPLDHAQFYVYPSGEVLAFRIDGSPGSTSWAYELELSEDALVDLMTIASDLRLTGGGLQPIVPLPTTYSVTDGGDFFFVSHSDGEFTARVVEQLSEVGRDGDSSVPGRIGYTELLQQFLPLFEQLNDAVDRGGGTVPLDQWAIVSSPLKFEAERDSDAPWTGPDLDQLPWQPIGAESLCTIVEDDDWPLGEADRRHTLVIDGRFITRRPLLPHESTCDDVAELRIVLGLDESSTGDVADVDLHDTARWTGGLDGPVILGRSNNDAEEALAQGNLLLENGCLLLESPGGGVGAASRAVIIWRSGTTWREADQTVFLDDPERTRVRVGDRVVLGGGGRSVDGLEFFVTDPEALARVTECLELNGLEEIWVNQ